ncbi:flagellar basal body protein [Ligilactobacillus salitolerans]|uniref:Flagellar basal body protein n=1 Tax=Ligilactobacillus salitolerans TaxID=1808352 RepID=A0A401ITT4_9LACO|nr:flagellar hook-basal body protein [Ligilactobacillus salitolerans]GBG94915.1 flagellar basal body protein [Ligilactobacillus salitolerans]
MNLNSILSINRTGLNGLQDNLDNISHNIANSSTVGYKGMVSSFNELMNNNLTENDLSLGQNAGALASSSGINVGSNMIDDRVGEYENTGRSLDLAIKGNAFFGLQGPNGQIYLTKAGDFHRDETGALVASNGYRVAVNAQVPQQNWPAGDLKISPNGQISAGQQVLGQLQLYTPNNEHSLVSVGANLYQARGGFTLGAGNSTVMQGTLESANVDLAQEMTNMISTQRSYQLNSRAVSATDEMMESINHFTD